MIIHAKLAKLNRHLGGTYFDRAMREIEAANEEGLTSFEVDINYLERDEAVDLIDALEEFGYDVTYTPGDETLYVSNE